MKTRIDERELTDGSEVFDLVITTDCDVITFACLNQRAARVLESMILDGVVGVSIEGR